MEESVVVWSCRDVRCGSHHGKQCAMGGYPENAEKVFRVFWGLDSAKPALSSPLCQTFVCEHFWPLSVMPGMAKKASLIGPSCPTLVIGHPFWRCFRWIPTIALGEDKGETFGLARMLMVSATAWKHTWDCLGLAGHFIIPALYRIAI